MRRAVILFLFSMCYCVGVNANSIEIISDTEKKLVLNVSSSYVMGDGDTRVDAKNIALQLAKKSAAEKAGSYVQAERIIQDDEIKKDSISMISTAMMNVEVKSERFSITDSQRTKIELTIQASLDKGSVMAKLGVLKGNTKKKKQIITLQKENSSLRSELSLLNHDIQKLKAKVKSSSVTTKRTDLIERRDVVLSKLEINESSVRKVFQKGTLFSMAKKSSVALDKAKRDIEFGIWEYIKESTIVKLGEPEFKDNGDGTYDIQVKVNWAVNGSEIVQTLNKYFREYSGRKFKLDNVDFSDHMGTSVPGIKIKKYHNEKEDQLLPYTYELYKYLLKKQVNVVVSAAGYNSQITIATSRSCWVSCGSHQGDSQYQIHFNNSSNSKKLIFDYSQQNPIVIKNVPESVLQNLTNIDAAIKII